MKNKMMFFGWVCFCFVFLGCAPQGMYYYGNYSQTLYGCEKNQNDESLLKHKQELEKIIFESEKRSLSVPPGIYGELGYLYLKGKDPKMAIQFFQLESQLYPESKHLMDRLIQVAQNKDDQKNNEPDKTKVIEPKKSES